MRSADLNLFRLVHTQIVNKQDQVVVRVHLTTQHSLNVDKYGAQHLACECRGNIRVGGMHGLISTISFSLRSLDQKFAFKKNIFDVIKTINLLSTFSL